MKTVNYFLCILAIMLFTRCSKDEVISPSANSPISKVDGTTSAKPVKPANYPSYNTSPLPPDQTGMTSTAVQIAANIRLGWNLGNTLEAIGGETAWGNPL